MFDSSTNGDSENSFALLDNSENNLRLLKHLLKFIFTQSIYTEKPYVQIHPNALVYQGNDDSDSIEVAGKSKMKGKLIGKPK